VWALAVPARWDADYCARTARLVLVVGGLVRVWALRFGWWVGAALGVSEGLRDGLDWRGSVYVLDGL